MTMPTQRPPFFASFFGAFRVRTSPTFQAKSSNPSTSISSSITANGHLSNGGSSSASRSITTTSSTSPPNTEIGNPGSSAQAANTQTINSSSNSKPSSPFSATAFTSTSPGAHHGHSPFYPLRSPGTASPSANPHGSAIPLTRGRQRRGSDSSNSSGGFMEALGSGSEKWYIGGRTAGGDERFYRLGLVTAGGGAGSGRATSLDRLSL